MNRLLLLTVVAIVVAVLGYLASKNFEYYDEPVDLGWSNEAKINEYLALQRYLENSGLQADSLVRIPVFETLDNADVLVVPAANQILSQSQKEMILTWVSNGGLLMLGVGYGDEPPILGELQFTAKSRFWNIEEDEQESSSDALANDVDEDAEDGEGGEGGEEDRSLADKLREENQRILEMRNKQSEKEGDGDGEQDKIACEIPGYFCGAPLPLDIDDKRLTHVSIKGGEDASIYVDAPFFLEHPAFEGTYGDAFIELNGVTAEIARWNGTENGTTHAEVLYGTGTIHVFSRLNFLTNQAMSQADHAYFIAQLTGSKNSALIIFGKDMPSLAQLVYRHFFEVLVAGFFVIICAMAYFGRRLGRVESLANFSRRSRAERFNAVASFRWQNNDREGLVKSAREQVLAKASRRWFGFQQWPIRQQVSTLSAHSELKPAAVEAALFDTKELSEYSYTHTIKVLQALRNCL